MSWITYDLATGRIAQIGVAPAPEFEVDQEPLEGQGILRKQDLKPKDLQAYFIDLDADPPQPMAREANPATLDKEQIQADGVDAATVSGLPADSFVQINKVGSPVGDGEIVITTDAPGPFRIRCDSVRCLPVEFEVTAV